MPESIDLKAEMAACWKLVWNDDPLAFSVPDRLELVLGLLAPPLGVLLLELLLELQALTMSIARAAVVSAAQRVLLVLGVITGLLFSLTTEYCYLTTECCHKDGVDSWGRYAALPDTMLAADPKTSRSTPALRSCRRALTHHLTGHFVLSLALGAHGTSRRELAGRWARSLSVLVSSAASGLSSGTRFSSSCSTR
jgi:hypothetical protein